MATKNKRRHKRKLSRRLNVVDMEEMFAKVHHPVMLNDLPTDTAEGRAAISSMMKTTYDNDDVMSSVPACYCGAIASNLVEGKTCEVCGTKVSLGTEIDIGSVLWMRSPEKVHGFLTPIIYIQLANVLSPGKYNLLDWILNTNAVLPARPSAQTVGRVEYLKSVGWERGLNYFHDNYEKFISLLPGLKVKDAVGLQKHLLRNFDKAFTKVLPIPSKSLLVLERTDLGNFADPVGSFIMEATLTLSDISDREEEATQTWLENKTATIIKNFGSYYIENIKRNMMQKEGSLRSMTFAARGFFTTRGVISSIRGVHHYEEMHISWTQGLELLRYHILNKLFAKGYSELAATKLLAESGRVYNKLLDDIMKDLIREAGSLVINGSTTPGISVTMQRNPSLERLSAQNLFLSKVKTDLTDTTIDLSTLILKGPNADFDGDQVNVIMHLDGASKGHGSWLRPHFGLFSLTKIGTFSMSGALPDVTHSTLANWYNDY